LLLLLQVFIDKFSQVFPDYRERVVAHEAAHLLIGELQMYKNIQIE
jgi:hypothetical protein